MQYRCLWLTFTDGSALTAMTQMWGAMELYEAGQEQEQQYVKGMRPTPVEPEFTFAYFSALVDGLLTGEKQSVKGLSTQEQLIPGLGNAICQDILFRARLHPRHPIGDLSQTQRRALYDAILGTVQTASHKVAETMKSISTAGPADTPACWMPKRSANLVPHVAL